jgi:hypothetical protein
MRLPQRTPDVRRPSRAGACRAGPLRRRTSWHRTGPSPHPSPHTTRAPADRDRWRPCRTASGASGHVRWNADGTRPARPWWRRGRSPIPAVGPLVATSAVCSTSRAWGVELPGVEPGSRGPVAVGSTCVDRGSSRTRCSSIRQLPRSTPSQVSPLRSTVEVSGWSSVMSIRSPYRASEGDRRRCLSCESQFIVGVCGSQRVINEVTLSILGTLPRRRTDHGRDHVSPVSVEAFRRCAVVRPGGPGRASYDTVSSVAQGQVSVRRPPRPCSRLTAPRGAPTTSRRCRWARHRGRPRGPAAEPSPGDGRGWLPRQLAGCSPPEGPPLTGGRAP